ncbi:MAG: ATP-binding cassette domain-containing protein [Candidatus Poseidoniales archaeon]|nr:ATP-binding cassette domain-containing protein [Candidatus Poseidoniales archaeon]
MALLQVEALTVRRGTRTVLEDFNMKIDSGNCIILTGENGSGKSTLVEAIAGILPIQSGKVTLTRPFGLTLQSGGFNGDELVSERVNHAAAATGVRGNTNLLKHWNLNHRSHDRIGHLSGGMSRRLAVLQGLMPGYGEEPRLCLLGEPSEGSSRRQIRGCSP